MNGSVLKSTSKLPGLYFPKALGSDDPTKSSWPNSSRCVQKTQWEAGVICEEYDSMVLIPRGLTL